MPKACDNDPTGNDRLRKSMGYWILRKKVRVQRTEMLTRETCDSERGFTCPGLKSDCGVTGVPPVEFRNMLFIETNALEPLLIAQCTHEMHAAFRLDITIISNQF
jgi:hypothetical protein